MLGVPFRVSTRLALGGGCLIGEPLGSRTGLTLLGAGVRTLEDRWVSGETGYTLGADTAPTL